MKYANPWKRLFAFVIDVFALIGIYMILGLLLQTTLFVSMIGVLHMIGFWFYGSLFCVSWIYFAAFESSSWQGTIGKHFLGLKVVDIKGQRISFFRATARYLLNIISRAILYIGILMVFFTKKKQTFHDKCTSTLILDSR